MNQPVFTVNTLNIWGTSETPQNIPKRPGTLCSRQASAPADCGEAAEPHGRRCAPLAPPHRVARLEERDAGHRGDHAAHEDQEPRRE